MPSGVKTWHGCSFAAAGSTRHQYMTAMNMQQINFQVEQAEIRRKEIEALHEARAAERQLAGKQGFSTRRIDRRTIVFAADESPYFRPDE